MNGIETTESQMIDKVMQEREKMVKVAKKIVCLINNPKRDHVAIKQEIYEFLGHLANIGSFCDQGFQNALTVAIIEISAFLVLDDPTDGFYNALRAFCGVAIGVQVDYNKKPFLVIGLSVGAFGAKFKVIFERLKSKEAPN